jgi:hypothetical protein
MRAVLTGTDFVRDTDGSFKAIETNTNIHPAVDLRYYFDLNALDQIIDGTSINEIHLINKRNLRGAYTPEVELTPESENTYSETSINSGSAIFSDIIEHYCQTKGFQFNNILLDSNSMTIPHMEDSENKLIIRIAYDVTALIDDTYARDNWEFLKLMYDSNPTSIPATYISDSELGFDSIGTTLRDNGVHPNYMVKKRITPADNHIHPKLYKISTIEELENLKIELDSDEYIQEYVINDSDLLDGKLTHYRSVDLIYGSNLDVLNLWSVQFSNAIDFDSVCDYDDNGMIPIWERPKYLYKYNNSEKTPKISGDGSTKVFLPDNSLVELSSLNLNDTVKSINIPGLPIDEHIVNLNEWSSSYSNMMSNFQIDTTQLTDIVKRENYVGFFWTIECSDGIKFSDVSHAIILKKELESGSSDNYVIKFAQYNHIEQNDTLILFDSQTNSLVEKTVENITFSYDEVEVYAVNFEQFDVFLTSEEGGGLRYGLLTHNYGFDCLSITATCLFCLECANNSAANWSNLQCCRCGGPGYPSCDASGFFGNCYGTPCGEPYPTPAQCQTGGYCNFNKSDIAHKENIKWIGKSEKGINIYQFTYKGEEGLYEGVIGNELIGTEFENALLINPTDNLLMVDYYKIDVQFKKIN